MLAAWSDEMTDQVESEIAKINWKHKELLAECILNQHF